MIFIGQNIPSDPLDWHHAERRIPVRIDEAAFHDQLIAALARWMEDRQCAQKCDGPHEDCPCVYCRTGMLLAKAKGEDR